MSHIFQTRNLASQVHTVIQKVFIRNVSLTFYANSKFGVCFEVHIPVRIVKLFMLEKQKELSTYEPVSTSQPSNQPAKEATQQNTVGITTMTLIGITRKYWILKRIRKLG